MTVTFEIENIKVIFESVNLIGFTHKIAIFKDGVCVAKDWHKSEYNANKQAAEYYYSKHLLKVNNEALLRKAVKKQIKPQVSSKKAFSQWLADHDFQVVGVMGHYIAPIDAYVKEVKEDNKWNKGSFLYGNVYHNCPRWIIRFRNYCETQHKREVLGVEVLTILNSKEWDNKAYDD